MIVRKTQKSRVEVIVVKETEEDVILPESDHSEDDSDDFRDFEAVLGAKSGKCPVLPPGEVMAPPYIDATPPGYMSDGLVPVN